MLKIVGRALVLSSILAIFTNEKASGMEILANGGFARMTVEMGHYSARKNNHKLAYPSASNNQYKANENASSVQYQDAAKIYEEKSKCPNRKQ